MKCLQLTDGYRVVATPLTWVLQKVTPQDDGEERIERVAFCTDLSDMLDAAISRDIRIPAEVHELNHQMKELTKFIHATIGTGVKVKDLFKEVADAEEKSPEEEEDPLDFLR